MTVITATPTSAKTGPAWGIRTIDLQPIRTYCSRHQPHMSGNYLDRIGSALGLTRCRLHHQAIDDEVRDCVWGLRDGYLIVLGPGAETGDGGLLWLFLRCDSTDEQMARNALQQNLAPLALPKMEIGVLSSGLRQGDEGCDLACVTWNIGDGEPDDEVVVRAVNAAADALRQVARPLSGRCELCGRDGAVPMVRGTVPGMFCQRCVEEAHQKYLQAVREFRQQKPRMAAAIIAGVLAALATGAVAAYLGSLWLHPARGRGGGLVFMAGVGMIAAIVAGVVNAAAGKTDASVIGLGVWMSTGAYAWAVVCYWVLVVERTTRLPFGKHLLALAVAAFGAQAIQNVIAVGVGWCLMIFALGQGAKVATDRPKPAITFEKLAARAARKDA